jgi:hypothetical protein
VTMCIEFMVGRSLAFVSVFCFCFCFFVSVGDCIEFFQKYNQVDWPSAFKNGRRALRARKRRRGATPFFHIIRGHASKHTFYVLHTYMYTHFEKTQVRLSPFLSFSLSLFFLSLSLSSSKLSLLLTTDITGMHYNKTYRSSILIHTPGL